MRSKSSNKVGEKEVEIDADYISLLRNKNFDFYGIFSYLQLDFRDDHLVEEMYTKLYIHT
jgi:hypothetical protein